MTAQRNTPPRGHLAVTRVRATYDSMILGMFLKVVWRSGPLRDGATSAAERQATRGIAVGRQRRDDDLAVVPALGGFRP